MTHIPPALARLALPAALAAALAAPALSAGTPPGSTTPPARSAAPQPWSPPPGAPGLPQTPKKGIRYIDGLPDTPGVFLPDTATLGRVNERRFTAGEFIDTYYTAYAPDRPARDSLGRVEWLNSMVNKEVMGRVALKANRPPTYEDRLKLRQHRERVLSNVLYQRAVLDSVVVTDDEVRAILPQCKVERHVRRIQFVDRGTAERVRADLVAKRATWEEAARRYRLADDKAPPDGDIGWLSRMGLPYRSAEAIYALTTGEISPVVDEGDRLYILQMLGERPAPPYQEEMLERSVRDQIRSEKIRLRVEHITDQMRREAGLQYDSSNVAFACARFEPAVKREIDKGTPVITVSADVPTFPPQDTSRVLARYEGGQLTLGGFLDMYSQLPAPSRPNVTSPELLREQIDHFVLEPYNARLAERRGLDKDSLAVALIEKERERILVEHMYQDSIESKIRVSPDARRKYYREHQGRFITYQNARFATFEAADSAGAEAMADRLRKGEKAEDILRADSIAGRPARGALHEEREDEHGVFHRMVYALKPGQVMVTPGKGVWATIQLLSMDPGRQLSFEESDGYIYDALASIESEKLLNQFLARHRRSFRIETRPRLVMRIRLVDPSAGL